VKEYYDTRAPEYDEWYLGRGRLEGLRRPHWDEDLRELEDLIAGLPAKPTLDVACGTGFLSRHLNGEVTLFDQSERMLTIAREGLPGWPAVRGDALALPFADDSFDRVFTAHFYGHLEARDREPFLAEARRVAPELLLIDAARRPDHEAEEWQERELGDGSHFEVYKRFFAASELAEELGGGTILLENHWFVAVASPRA
jgi:ubiquinone/menaquinone biosynthesis C-methylase UbiE